MHSVDSITPIILAAGDSKRMGHPKALLPLESDVFITHILKTCKNAGFGKPTVVLGRSAPYIAAYIEKWNVDIQINPDTARGQLSSIQLAMSSLRPENIAAMIWPVDQPLVSADLILSLARLFLSSNALIAHPVCGERNGHPAIFHRRLFQEFMEAPLDDSPKNIIRIHEAESVYLSTNETGTIHDIDTPADYETACGTKLNNTAD